MLHIDHAPGGLLISRWNGTDPLPLEQLFVADEDLAAFIADLVATAAGQDDTARWDTYALLCGNPMDMQAAM
jgi:hypothetical protein